MKRAVGVLAAVLVAYAAGSCFAQESNAPAVKQDENKAAAKEQENTMVLIKTSMGNIKVELFDKQAPETVKNFLQYVDAKHYDGTIFHRVIDNFMIQGGGFTKDLAEKPTKPSVTNEASAELKNVRGTIAMARTSVINSATAQFFINVLDNAFLDHKDSSVQGFGYCVFGKVVDGMDVVDKIKSVKTGGRGPFRSDVPIVDVEIKEISRVK
jgi:cyclophilin family peptidyl-prolyl cis-trans isomerase